MKLRILAIVLFAVLTGYKAGNAAPTEPEEFRVFPNPVINNEITVRADIDFYKIEILSIVGQVVYTQELEPSRSARLDIDLESGIYLIRISFTNRTNNIKRLWIN